MTVEEPPSIQPEAQRLHALQQELREFTLHKQHPNEQQLEHLTTDFWAVSGAIAEKLEQLDEADMEGLHKDLFDTYHLLSRFLGREASAPHGLDEPFNILTQATNRLEFIRARGSYSNEEVEQLQQQVEHVREQYQRDNEFISASGDPAPPKVQTAMRSLMNHSQHLIREMLRQNQAVDDFMRQRIDRARKVVNAIEQVESDVKSAKNIDVAWLQRQQEEVNSIEAEKLESSKTGFENAAPRGQAQLTSLLELARESIYDLLCLQDGGETPEPSAAEPATERIKHVVDEGLHAVTVAAGKMGRAVSASYHRVADMVTNSVVHQAVDPKLHGIQTDLLNINNRLRGLRNDWYFSRSNEKQLRQELAREIQAQQRLKEEFSPLRQRLLDIDSARVDGRFVGADSGLFAPPGQGTLAELLERNFAILREVEVND